MLIRSEWRWLLACVLLALVLRWAAGDASRAAVDLLGLAAITPWLWRVVAGGR